MTGFRQRWRRTGFGLSTLLGRPRGFFAPYRHAATVRAPTGYPEIERYFAAAEPEITVVLTEIARHRARLASFAGPAPEPRWDQTWFPRLDGAAAYALVHRAKPRRVIEVGSGHSTRLLARAIADAGTPARHLCIDPEPRASLKGLAIEWRARVLGEADLALFAALGPGDIAFFDGSHLLWPGSDVDIILNRILPALAPGVLVHLHDIFLPDPYPPGWAWRGYTEHLALAGWLAGGCRIRFASRYALTRLSEQTQAALGPLPLAEGAWESALWLERV